MLMTEKPKQSKTVLLFWRTLGIGTAVIAAICILLLSLASSVMGAHSNTSLLSKSFYIDDVTLPDHISYPFLMMIDRVRLEVASDHEQVYLKTEYANRRLLYSVELLKRDNTSLAVSTLTKAQKYLLYAAGIVFSENMSDHYAVHVSKTIEYHLKQIDRIFSNDVLNDQEKAVIDRLNEELRVILSQLQTYSQNDN